MNYWPDEYEGYHQGRPDRKAVNPAFSTRGATLTVLRLLVHMRLVGPRTDLKEFVVVKK